MVHDDKPVMQRMYASIECIFVFPFHNDNFVEYKRAENEAFHACGKKA